MSSSTWRRTSQAHSDPIYEGVLASPGSNLDNSRHHQLLLEPGIASLHAPQVSRKVIPSSSIFVSSIPLPPPFTFITHPWTGTRRMESSGVPREKWRQKIEKKVSKKRPAYGDRSSQSRSGVRGQGFQVDPASQIDWSMNPGTSSPESSNNRADKPSRPWKPVYTDHSNPRPPTHRATHTSRGSSPNQSRYQRPAMFLTEQERIIRDLNRQRREAKIERKNRKIQTKNDRIARRHARKDQKVQDYQAELERLRQIRIAGDNDLNSGLVHFPAIIEPTKKVLKARQKKLAQIEAAEAAKNRSTRVDRASSASTSPRDKPGQLPVERGRSRPETSPKAKQPPSATPRSARPTPTKTSAQPDQLRVQATPQLEQNSSRGRDVQSTTASRGARSESNLISEPDPRPTSRKHLNTTSESPQSHAQQRDVKEQVTRPPSSGTNHKVDTQMIPRESPPHNSFTPSNTYFASTEPKNLRNTPPSTYNATQELSPPLFHTPRHNSITPGNAYFTSTEPKNLRNTPPSTYNAPQELSPPLFHAPPLPDHGDFASPFFHEPPLPDEGDFVLKNQLVKFYMAEDGVASPTPEHHQRSEGEFGWLKAAAIRQIKRARLSALSPTSMSDHLQVQDQVSFMVQNLMKEWIGEYTLNKKPIAYIIGDIPFGNLTLAIQPPILIPRPETENWTVKLSKMIKGSMDSKASQISKQEQQPPSQLNAPSTQHHVRVLDIGTGSGCISNYLAYNHANTFVLGVDLDHRAVELAQRNAFTHGLTLFQARNRLDNHRTKNPPRGNASFMVADLFSTSFEEDIINTLHQKLDPELVNTPPENEHQGFDIVISNPPYITRAAYERLPPSVKNWESPLALIGNQNLTSDHRSRHLPPQHLTQSRLPQSFNKPVPVSTSPLLPQTVSVMQELGLKLPKKIRQTPSPADQGTIPEKDDGLDFYRRIINLVSKGNLLRNRPLSDKHTKRGTRSLPRIVLEVGEGQAEAVRSLMLESLKPSPAAVSRVEIWDDYAGIGRVVVGFNE